MRPLLVKTRYVFATSARCAIASAEGSDSFYAWFFIELVLLVGRFPERNETDSMRP